MRCPVLFVEGLPDSAKPFEAPDFFRFIRFHFDFFDFGFRFQL